MRVAYLHLLSLRSNYNQ